MPRNQAAHRGLAETARASLQRTVPAPPPLAHDDADFLDRLRDAGLRVRESHGDDGTPAGYAVTMPLPAARCPLPAARCPLPGDCADRGGSPRCGPGTGARAVHPSLGGQVRHGRKRSVMPSDVGV
ncbi:hypothetical protein [Streptomyces yangpuensis]